ncbi:MAG: maltose alpha-D-glucosyltransferase [Actinomycetota bacterium]|nr:maltose alpha-D-glucosyltransferase [Actinomycetota bacterium]
MVEPRAEPEWYRDAVIYELHVRAFADGNGDGIGDFTGLLRRLDHLSDLGVTAIWLLPFYPSPLRDDGYDISDFTGVHPAYGDLRTFKRVLAEAHRRDLRVITELVLNHTSDQHAWFRRAQRAAPGSVERDFYVWSDDPERYPDARIIFGDFETSNWTWDPVAGAYYWHRFYSHQPDLNFDNPAVVEAVDRTIDQWLDLGVDGVRLDAVPYLFERDGTNCENLPETHAFLKRLRRHIDDRYDDRMLLAEANQWPEDAASYFGDGDECHMNFHFPVMPRLFMALQREDRMPVVDILEQTPELPPGCQWAMFLRNHDELTLEMVTDEERDYMYRAYASDPQMRVNLGIRRRLAPLLGNDRRKIELLNALLFSLPGTPVIYYGDEIGMGDNVYLGDRDSVRTPMQWSPDRNAGFSIANPHQLFLPAIIDPEYHYETVNVETQRARPNSLLSWMRQLVALRRRHRVLGRGSLEMLEPENPHVLAFIRHPEDDEGAPMLVVANLSRLAQHVELDLRDHLGATPVEAFGHTEFAPIGELPYYLTLSPYGFFWFELRPARAGAAGASDGPRALGAPPEQLLARPGRELTEVVAAHVQQRRWFGGRDRAVVRRKVLDVIALGDDISMVVLQLDYADGEPDIYSVPLAAISGTHAEEMLVHHPEVVLGCFGDDGERHVLADALGDAEPAARLVAALAGRRRPRGAHGSLTVELPARLRARLRELAEQGDVRVMGAEQSNSSIVVGNEVVLKAIRRVHDGVNPDLELGRHLTEVGYEHVAPVLGALTWEHGRSSATLGVLTAFVANEGDTWQHFVDDLSRTLEDHVRSADPDPSSPRATDAAVFERPAAARRAVSEQLGPFVETLDLLGRRTAEMHLALADSDDPDMVPERFTSLSQRSLYQGVRSQVRGAMSQLRRSRKTLDEPTRDLVDEVLSRSDDMVALLEPLRGERLGGRRIRVHGDFHLGQTLWTGRDVVMVDFEGEPARPVTERRIRRSPLADVAGMLRSFGYASRTAVREQVDRGLLPEPTGDSVDEPAAGWAQWWEDAAGIVYLEAYLDEMGDSELLPEDPQQIRMLLVAHLLEKAAYESLYELRYRPALLSVPLRALLSQVDR